MKRIVPFLLLYGITFVQAQGWRQTFEGLLSPAAVCQTPDGGAVLLANTIPGPTMDKQIILTKTNQDGRLQWQKMLGASGDDEGRALLLTQNGQIAVAGKVSFIANNGDALLALYNLNGQKLWERNYNFGVLDDVKAFCQLPDGGFALAIEADNQLRLLRTDANGIELWSKTFPETAGLLVKNLELRSDQGFVATLLRNILPIGAPAAVVLQISPTGDLEFQRTIPHFSNDITTDQVRCKPAGDSTYWLMHRDSVYLLDQDTNILKRFLIDLPFDFYLTDLIPSKEAGFFVLGTNYSFSGTAFSRTYFAHFLADGTEVWRRFYNAPNYLHASWAAFHTQDGGFFLSGNYAKNGNYFSYLLRTDSLGQAFTNQISGQVFWDKNKDCLANLAEPSLKGWLLRMERPNGDLQYASTDSSGMYRFEAGIGAHRISVLLPNGLWASDCFQDVITAFDVPFDSETIDFPIKSTSSCPLPRVDAGVDYWVHCAENQFIVRYANSGSATAENAAVILTLDSLLTLSSASIPFTQEGPHSWRFPLGDLQALADSNFQVQIQSDCATETLDRSLCIQASIEPDAPCLAPVSGPLLVAEGHCTGDSVRFQVRNIGLPMLESQPYIVVEDNIMFLPATGEIQLDAGELWSLSFPATGATWRLEILQNPGTPDWLSDSQLAAVVEGCSVSGAFSTGYVNQFSLYDGGYFTETECRPVVANAQGLEKTAYPGGWNAEHLIQPNTDLEYALHFQNNSGDSILMLTLRDTLDHLLLDPSSVLPGPASHPYQFELSGAGVLSFQFTGIGLVDSARAWVKFRVAQQPDLSAGMVIYNQAWAYPNFKAPTVTNQTFHTIGAPFFTGVNTPQGFPQPSLSVWPIPTSSELNLILQKPGDYVCQLFDLSGRKIWEKAFSATLQIGRAHV